MFLKILQFWKFYQMQNKKLNELSSLWNANVTVVHFNRTQIL